MDLQIDRQIDKQIDIWTFDQGQKLRKYLAAATVCVYLVLIS